MKTNVEPLSETELKVDVEVPVERVDREYAKQLRHFGKRARIKGFRPGKVPKSLIRKQFATAVSSEASRQLISDTLSEVLDGLERTPIGQPTIEPGVAREGEAFKYAIRVQVKPLITVHSWSGIEISVPPAIARDAEIDERIEALRASQRERIPVEDRGADTGDILLCTIEGSLEGTRDPRLDAKDLEIRLGSGRMIPGFEDQLMGATAGAKLEIEATFPDDYQPTDLAGKAARWQVEILQHVVEETPALDDEFARDAGFDDLASLRADIVAKVQADADKRRTDEIERKAIEILLERNQFEVPNALVDSYTEQRAQQMLEILAMQGLGRDQAIEIINSNVDGLRAAALTSVRRYLLLEAFAAQEEIEVSEEELAAEIVSRIESGGEATAKVYEAPEMRENVRSEMTQRRALEVIVNKARVVDELPKTETDDDEPAAETSEP